MAFLSPWPWWQRVSPVSEDRAESPAGQSRALRRRGRRQRVLTEQRSAACLGRVCLSFAARPNLSRLPWLEKGRVWRSVSRWTDSPSPCTLGLLVGNEADGRTDSAQGWFSPIWGLSGKQAAVSYFLLPGLRSCLGSKENLCVASDKMKLAESWEEASSEIRPTSRCVVGTLFVSVVTSLVCRRISFSFLLPQAVLDGTVEKNNLKSISGL